MTEEPSPAAPAIRSRRKTPVALAAAILAFLVLALSIFAVMRTRRSEDPVSKAIAVARTPDGYDTGLEAGQTLARVASALNEGIRDCDRAEEADRCAALGAASGYVQVVAATVVRCTAPGRVEARQSVLAMLRQLDEQGAGASPSPPSPPPLPDCEG